MAPEDAVRYEVRDDVALLTIDFPPVNALGAPVRDGMILRLDQALTDPAAEAIVIVGANHKFIAGADIREFGKPMKGAHLTEIQEKMEKADKPVVAAIDGHALGGGLETALAAHFRVAAGGAKLGLPEVNLGLLPGGGGTQRLTRLVGPDIALDLILGGTHFSGPRARELGVVDAVADGDLIEAAIAFAKGKAEEGGPWPVILERVDKVKDVDPAIFAAVRAKNASKWKGTVAPFKIVDCIEAATKLDPHAGLAFESAAFRVCDEAPSRAAQVHLFFAARATSKVNDVPADVRPKTIGSVGIVGAGTMGAGIAMSIANAGIPVKLLDATQDAIDAGMTRIKDTYRTSLARGSTTQDAVDGALARIEPARDFSAFADVDMVIEAVFENLEVKHEVFRKLDAVCHQGAILASNTSALNIDEIASVVSRRQNVIGLHFFSPANVMKLIEVVRGDFAAPETVVTAMNFAKAIDKIPVLAGNCDGFIGNRILLRYGAEADALLVEGATPWSLDHALKEFGFPMGVYLMRDMAGLDVGWRIRANRIREGKLDPEAPDYMPLLDRLCEKGRLGQKTGAGVYRYEGREPSPDAETEEMLKQISAEKGITRREIGEDEMVRRVLCAMVNEGAKILEEGIAQRASDIDVTYVYGYGFPKYRGGPMFWAEQQGLDNVYADIKRFENEYGARWKPAELLKKRAESGKDWNG